ncbi:hypothetical protein CH330_08705 [candidate division WOR-3 bacterium JGI_Cruoil_03_51_56]|uniref:Glycosyltransferase 2-like domain-containing protein n=1 Tax=candidate division WOR-3 bacterium JGI_Cruoil_03_51_56 TaxID=1973747 RepID=A0A235BQD5_UNCW3|nr:MAG: hypothetical protein CH330_08705 [candidate division WOR-3 bacterium JGI_Cruoil_03_51_56]
MVRLSVVIVNYGALDIVTPCLESLAADSNSGLIEVILVDNGTPSFSANELQSKFRWVHIIACSENRGFAAGCNIGIRDSQGEYLLLLNPDTRIPKGTLRTMADYMAANPDVGAATCRVNLSNGSLDPACHRGFPTPWASLCYFLGLEKLLPMSRLFGRYHLTYEDLEMAHEIDAPSGCFFIVRRSVVETVGLLDEEFFLYGEDIDWAMRIKEAGWKIMFNPAVSIVHLKGMASGIKLQTTNSINSLHSERERAYHAFFEAMRIFYRKHYRSRYPFFVGWLVSAAISIREKLGHGKKTV